MKIQPKDLKTKLTKFEQKEPRAFCWWDARKKIRQAKSKSKRESSDWYSHPLTIEGIILIEYTWNFAAIKTKRLTNENIGHVLKVNKKNLRLLENRSLTEKGLLEKKVKGNKIKVIKGIFKPFKEIFGQTGASKALSILNPHLYVMWDTRIRAKVQEERGKRGKSRPSIRSGRTPKQYITYLRLVKQMIDHIEGTYTDKQKKEIGRPKKPYPKIIDEYLYAKYVLSRSEKV